MIGGKEEEEAEDEAADFVSFINTSSWKNVRENV